MFNNKIMQAAALAGALALPVATVWAQPPVIADGNLINIQIVNVIDD